MNVPFASYKNRQDSIENVYWRRDDDDRDLRYYTELESPCSDYAKFVGVITRYDTPSFGHRFV